MFGLGSLQDHPWSRVQKMGGGGLLGLFASRVDTSAQLISAIILTAISAVLDARGRENKVQTTPVFVVVTYLTSRTLISH